ncbi:MAG: DMT family transporter, partial [Gammaproteobacteria bacterium]
IVLGFGGLVVIFGNGIDFSNDAGKGVLAVLFSVVLHSISAVWVKAIDARLPAMEVTHGGLMVAAPLYLLTWFSYDGVLPEHITTRALMAILYLAVFGSVLGFMMYYYILKHMEASRVALATLITPVTALMLGQLLNNESLNPVVWIGTAMILVGMSFYQWGSKLVEIFIKE